MNPDLSQLRDIHLPEPISWWPPALGWWLLLVLLMVLIALAYWFHRRRNKQQWRRDALAELQRLQSLPAREQIAEISTLLRRVAITCFPREEAASLTGERWLDFLDRTLNAKRSTKLPLPLGGEGRGEGVNKEIFFNKQGRILITAPYSNGVDADLTDLLTLCERWITGVAR